MFIRLLLDISSSCRQTHLKFSSYMLVRLLFDTDQAVMVYTKSTSNELSSTAGLGAPELHDFLLQLVSTSNNLNAQIIAGASLFSQQNLEILYIILQKGLGGRLQALHTLQCESTFEDSESH